MNMIPVISRNVAAVGYNSGNLYVAFKNTGTYCYYDVPESVFRALLSAPSKGSFLERNVKGIYRYQKC